MAVPKEFFIDADEEEIAVLGQGYLSSLLPHGTGEKAAVVLTNRRIYTLGKTYTPKGNFVTPMQGKQAVPLGSFAGTGYREYDFKKQKTSGIMSLVAAGFLFMLFLIGAGSGLTTFFIVVLIGAGVAMLALAAGKGGSYLFIDHSGGVVGIPRKDYPPQEIEKFQRMLYAEKEKAAKT